MSSSLSKAEWALTLSILLLIATFTLISKVTSFRNLKTLYEASKATPLQEIVVEVSGCVRKQGLFRVEQNTSLRSVLERAKPTAVADLSNLDGDQILTESCRIKVPELSSIRVWVEGAVYPSKWVELPVGSRVSDLKRFVALEPNADKTFFKKRRILKNGERLKVPCKFGGEQIAMRFE